MAKINKLKLNRPTYAAIDLEALRHNYRLARQWVGPAISLMSVIKANAYGHGAVQVAQVLEQESVAALGVASVEEALQLREAAIKAPIFLLGGPMAASGDLLREQNLTPFIYRLDQLESLSRSATQKVEIHLKVDTGMHRLGILPQELPKFLAEISQRKKIKLRGVLTHLAEADETFLGRTKKQFRLFEQIEKTVRHYDSKIKIYHMAHSAAILGGQLGPCNWARPGLMLYGANPHPRFERGKLLKPVMQFKTEIISLKKIPRGAKVSYGATWTATRPTWVATLAVGYADGYSRHLSNVGEVWIHQKKCPVIGRVCMDLTMVDVTELAEVKVGDEVILWGQGLPVEEVAARAGTIAYELLAQVNGRVKRIYRL